MNTLRYIQLMVILSSQALFAQGPDVLWTRAYGGSAHEQLHDIQITADGGFIAAGSTESYGAGGEDVYLVRTNANGDTLWTRVYGGANEDYAYSIEPAAGSGWIVAGSTASFGAGSDDVWVLRLNANGDTLWTRTLGTAQIDQGTKARETADGGFIVTGYSALFPNANSDGLLAKLNSSGVPEWSHVIGQPENHEALYDVHELPAGGLAVCGYNEDIENGNGSWDAWLILCDSQGLNLTMEYYGGFGWDAAYAMIPMPDGGFMLGGTTDLNFSVQTNFFLVRTDASLNELWSRNYGTNEIEDLFDLTPTADGGYLLTGRTCLIVVNQCRWNMFAVKADSNGDSVWAWEFGTAGASESAYAARQLSDGGFVVAGYNTPSAGNWDAYLVRLAAECSDPTPRAPESVTVRTIGNDLRLRWNGVRASVADCAIAVSGYTIYSDVNAGGAYLVVAGTTADTTFTDVNAAGAPRKFYLVKAIVP